MLIEISLLISAIPVGYIISWLTKDELIVGRKWFRIIIIASFIFGSWFFLTNEKIIGFSLFFICIVGFMSYQKSFDKKFIKKNTLIELLHSNPFLMKKPISS